MNRRNTILVSFTLIILSIAFYINEAIILSTVSLITSLTLLIVCLCIRRIKIQPVSLIFFISECALMLIDNSLPSYFHIGLMIFSSASYSILAKIKKSSSLFCSCLGLASVLLLVSVISVLAFFYKLLFGFSSHNLVHYIPLILSLTICWLVPFIRTMLIAQKLSN